MRITSGRKRKRSRACRKVMTQGGILLFGFGFCLLVWSSLLEEEQILTLDYQRMLFSMSSLSSSLSQQHKWRTKLILDFELGPAVEKAKYFGFQNRDSNQGHNRSDWDLLSTQTCDDDGKEESVMLSKMEIYQRKLPSAILLGVQKGGTTALSKYLFEHEEIERTEKELYVLDEAIDNHLFEQARKQQQHHGILTSSSVSLSIPRKRGRDLYSQMTLGITYKLARRKKREKSAGLVGTRGENSTTTTTTQTPEEARKQELAMKGIQQRLRQGQPKIYNNPGGPRRRLVGEEEEVADGGNGKVLVEHPWQKTSPPPQEAPIRWDPDSKMKRYFERRKTLIESDPSSNAYWKMTLDMTPNYMFHSDRVPARIECLVPWVKLFCILRNPIDRAISQYDMKMRVVKGSKINKDKDESATLLNGWGNPVPSLDQFVLNDLEALEEVGVLQDWTKVDFESFWKSEECWQAWKKYIHLGLNAPIGMGLYALQLKPFLDMMERVHHDSKTQEESSPKEKVQEYFLALDNQDLRNDPDVTYNRLLKFLQLQPKTLDKYKMTINQSTGEDGERRKMYKLSPSAEDRIKAAIKPYNKKLGELLGEEWGTK